MSLTPLRLERKYFILELRDSAEAFHGGEGCLVAIVSGTKSEDVIRALETIPEQEREKVQK